MRALGVELEKQRPQDAMVEGLDGRRHERNLEASLPMRNGRRPASYSRSCLYPRSYLLTELITARIGDYVRRASEIH